MPRFARVYTGNDGRSHVEDIEPPFERLTGPEAAVIDPGGLIGATAWENAAGITFRRSPPGHFQDWHIAPRRQYAVSLSGKVEVVCGDGTAHRFGPGDVLLAEDLTGEGHTTRVVGDEIRVYMVISLPD